MAVLRCVISLAIVAAAADAAKAGDGTCFLLDGGKPSKPFPSLTQCYKQNQMSCCVSAHDATIADTYSGYLSGTCIREYAALEEYACLGCSTKSDSVITWYNATGSTPKKYNKLATLPAGVRKEQDTINLAMVSSQYQQVVGKYGEFRVCKGFADTLLYAVDENGGKTGSVVGDAYDGCGLSIGKMAELAKGVLGSQAFIDSRIGQPVSGNPKVKHSAERNFFKRMRPEYFGADDFEISWHHTTNCYPGSATSLPLTSLLAVSVALAMQLFA